MKNARREKALFHDAFQPMSLGCLGCPEKEVCGGLQATAGLFDCMLFCQCEEGVDCQYVCPHKTEHFVNSIHEIGGFDFGNVPRSNILPMTDLPLFVPLLFHGSKRNAPLKAKAVALKLTLIADYQAGQLRYKSKEELAEVFKFDAAAKLIITGVDQDRFIEPYWTDAHQGKMIEELRELSPDLITVPNFSLFLQSPRWDNIHNMKRIAICWEELVSQGLPTSLHLNARTDRDWERWADFIGERDEVQSVALEFGTGLARKDRARWHIEKLLALAAQVKRPLHLVLRGGKKYLRELSSDFSSISLIDSTAFSRTRSRRQLVWQPGQPEKWSFIKMPETELLDELLQHNVNRLSEMRAHQIFH